MTREPIRRGVQIARVPGLEKRQADIRRFLAQDLLFQTSQIGQRQSAARPRPIPQLRILQKERIALSFKLGKRNTRSIQLDLIEIQGMRQLVFAHEVDFVLALPVPPSADSRIAVLVEELLSKIALKRKTGKDIEIPLDNGDELAKHLLLDQMLVFVDEPKPKAEKAIVNPIKTVFRCGPLTKRLDLRNEFESASD